MNLFTATTINSNYPASLVVAASNPGQTVLLFNADPSNTIWLADNNAFQAGDPNHASPLGPLSSVTFDGTENVYAATGTGLTATLRIYPTGSSYSQGMGINSLVSAGSVGGSPVTTVPASGFYNVMEFVDVSGFSSYDLNMFGYAVSPGAVGSVVAYQVQLAWYDDLISGVPVFEEDWYAWAGRAAPSVGSNTLAGCGPMHGRYMNVTIFVPIASTAGLVLQYVNIFGSFRTLPYSDWRQNGEAVDPQVNGLVLEAGGGLSFENILCSIQGATITTASRVYFIPLGLYAGPVYYAMSLSIAAGAAPVIAAVGGTVGGQLIAGNGCPGTLYVNGNVANTQYSGQLILPRSACAFIIQVPAGGSETFSLFVAAQQAA